MPRPSCGGAVDQTRHRRERAEPQPLLAPAVQSRRSSAAPAAYLALLAQTYDALKAASPDVRVYGGAVSPRGSDRAGGIRPTHSPTKFIEELGHRIPRERPRPAGHGRVRPSTSTATTRASRPTVGHPLTTSIGVADYGKLVSLLGAGVRRHGTTRFRPADPLRRVRRRVATSRRPSPRSTPGTEPTTTKPVNEATQAAYYRAGARAGVLPADRRRHAALPFARRAGSRRLAVRHQLRRRHAQVQPPARHGGARPDDRTVRSRAVPASSSPFARHISASARAPPRKRGRLPHEPPLRPRLSLLGAPRERRDAFDEARCAVGRPRSTSPSQADLGTRHLGPGRYRYTLSLVHPVNPAPPTIRARAELRACRSRSVAVLDAPDANDHVRAGPDDGHERERVAALRQAVADRQARSRPRRARPPRRTACGSSPTTPRGRRAAPARP